MGRSICVFCSSSDDVAPAYVDAAKRLGRAIAAGGHSLVYGGMDMGLMGTLAHFAHDDGARVVGVTVQFMAEGSDTYADELIVACDMHQREAMMHQLAEAFVVLPGGFGTLEETGQVLAFASLELHKKPIVIINTDGFYDSLLAMFDRFVREGFAKERHLRSYHVAADVAEAMSYLESRFADGA